MKSAEKIAENLMAEIAFMDLSTSKPVQMIVEALNSYAAQKDEDIIGLKARHDALIDKLSSERDAFGKRETELMQELTAERAKTRDLKKTLELIALNQCLCNLEIHPCQNRDLAKLVLSRHKTGATEK